MAYRLLLALLVLVSLSAVATASTPEQVTQSVEPELTLPAAQSESLVSTPDVQGCASTGLEIRWSSHNECSIESCDYSVDCYEGCEAQYPVSQEDPDSFCWCVRACSDICIF